MHVTDAMVEAALRKWWLLEDGQPWPWDEARPDGEPTGHYFESKSRIEMRAALEAAEAVREAADRAHRPSLDPGDDL